MKNYNKHILIASSRLWIPEMQELLATEFADIRVSMVATPEALQDFLHSNMPDIIFFPHWSYIIPSAIYDKHECIIFHMTDVPFGRGGSPLQNLISRGIYETKISALRCVKELDAGSVYLKRPLSLQGNAQEIYYRANQLIIEMIGEILRNQSEPVVQSGEVVSFVRRSPKESNIAELSSLQSVYDYIRMLDADGYPKAFIETNELRFEFSRASFKGNEIIADVRITQKKDNHNE